MNGGHLAKGRAGVGTGLAAVGLVFLGGFIIMVLEIAGARYLAGEFGGTFYVWVSQIGVVMIALAAGYYAGGALADRWQRLRCLAWVLIPTGILVLGIPLYAPPLIEAIVVRHPAEHPVPLLWQKLDPALGSAVIFLLPCLVLAMLTPYLIRLSARELSRLGRLTGRIIAWSTLGSIAGVFAAGYILIDAMRLSTLFRCMGGLMVFLGLLCVVLDRAFATGPVSSDAESS